MTMLTKIEHKTQKQKGHYSLIKEREENYNIPRYIVNGYSEYSMNH